MPEQQNNQLEGEQLLEAITRHVFLVMLKISWPKLSYQIADAIVEIKGDSGEENKEIDEEFRTKPQWQLMPEVWRKKLVNLEGRARAVLGSASVSFAARGISVLPSSRAEEVFAALSVLRTEMEQYRDEFVAEYANVIADVQSKLDEELFQKVRGKLPSSDEIANKFSMIWAIIPAGGRSGATPEQMDSIEQALLRAQDALPADNVHDREMLQDGLASVRQIQHALATRERVITDEEAAEMIDEAHAQMSEFTNNMLENMAREPRRMLLDAADNLLEALKDPQRMIRSGTINQVREAFEMVEGFEFLAGADLMSAMRECRKRLDTATPKQLNSDAEIGARLAAGLRGVRDEAADSQSATNAMRQFRRIRIRDEEPAPESEPEPEPIAA